MFQDRTLTCRDCGESFVFSSGEQEFFATKGLVNDPQRCPACRAAAKRARDTGAPAGGREYHAAVCSSCGGQAMVPFAAAQRPPGLLLQLLRQGARRGGRRLGLSEWRAPPWPMLGDLSSRRSGVGVIIVREMVGTSPKSWSDAARQAVATASKTVRNIRTIEVVKSTARIEDGEIVEYQVQLKIGFEYEG